MRTASNVISQQSKNLQIQRAYVNIGPEQKQDLETFKSSMISEKSKPVERLRENSASEHKISISIAQNKDK